MTDEALYSKVIHEDEEKGIQLRLTLSSFKGIEYLHFRKYYLSYDEGYLPTKDGIGIPASLQSIFSILDGLLQISSKKEFSELIKSHFLQEVSNEENT